MLAQGSSQPGVSSALAPSRLRETTGQLSGTASPARVLRREVDLDFLRGLAILMVLDFHAPLRWMSYPFARLGFPAFGWAGVDVFFVLSGFLVGGLLLKEWRLTGRVNARRFLIRRGLKIWPQYYVFLGLMLLTRHRTLSQLLGNLLNVQNYLGGIPHTWSLAVEEHAYLLLVALLAALAYFRRSPRLLLWLLLGGSLLVSALRFCLARGGHEVFNRTHTRLEGILEGVLLALLFHFWPEQFQRLQQRRWLWLLVLAASLAFLRFAGTGPGAQSLGWDAANFLGIALLLLLYHPGRVQAPNRLYGMVAWIGLYSYGIYLWHVAVIAPAASLSRHLPATAGQLCLALLPLVAGIAVGAVFTRLVESPVLALRDRFFPPQVDSAVGPPAAMEAHRSPTGVKPMPQQAARGLLDQATEGLGH